MSKEKKFSEDKDVLKIHEDFNKFVEDLIKKNSTEKNKGENENGFI